MGSERTGGKRGPHWTASYSHLDFMFQRAGKFFLSVEKSPEVSPVDLEIAKLMHASI
jgi:hypothetical protein